MRRFVVLLVAALGLPAAAQGIFFGAELVPLPELVLPLDGYCCWRSTRPAYTFGWESPVAELHGVSFLAMVGCTQPLILNDWYVVSFSVLSHVPLIDFIRPGVGYEAWFYYDAGHITAAIPAITITMQFLSGPFRTYIKARLPDPVLTDRPLLGATITLGVYFPISAFFPEEAEQPALQHVRQCEGGDR